MQIKIKAVYLQYQSERQTNSQIIHTAMGQYYKPVFKGVTYESEERTEATKGIFTINFWDYNVLAKLGESDYIHNPVMDCIESGLIEGGLLYKTNAYWCGDYAEKGFNGDAENNGYSYVSNLSETLMMDLSLCIKKRTKNYSNKMITKKSPFGFIKANKVRFMADYIYFVNHTKKEYFIKPKFDRNYLTVHPLASLLVDNLDDICYMPEGIVPFAGKWCGDVISLEKEIPEGMSLIEIPEARYKL